MVDEWRTWKTPERKQFNSEKDYLEYIELVRCAVCHAKLIDGEEWQLRSIETPEETGSLTVQAVIVHRKCLSHQKEEKP
jgi:hypothetical protein